MGRYVRERDTRRKEKDAERPDRTERHESRARPRARTRLSGTSERQLEAVADSVEKSLHEAGERMIGSEGGRGGRWVLLDFGDVVVHVFHAEERAYYDLEGLWSDAPMTRP